MEILTGDVLESQMGWREATLKETVDHLERELTRLAKKGAANTATETELAKLRSQSLSWVGLSHLREQVGQRLSSGTFEDRRFVLETLGTRVVATTEGKQEVEFTVPSQPAEEAIALNLSK